MAREKNVFDRVAGLGENAALKVAEQLMESPALMNALARTMQAKGKLDGAQQSAMAAFNMPTVREFDDLRTRVRTLTRRVEQLESQLQQQKASAPPQPRAGKTAARKGASSAGKKPPSTASGS